MAEGRMLNKRVCEDKAVNALSSDTSRLAFTWAIPHLDRDGRCSGDPVVLKSKVFPRREDITSSQMEGFIREWNEHDLAIWYEAKGELWLYFPGFKKNQRNLRYEREAPSAIPPAKDSQRVHKSSTGVAPEQVRTESAHTADLLPPNESNGREVNEGNEYKSAGAEAAPTASPAGSERPAGRPDTSAAKSDLPEPAIPLSGLTPELARRVTMARRAEAAREARRNGKSTTLVTTSIDNGPRDPPARPDIVNDDDDFDDAPPEVSDAAV